MANTISNYNNDVVVNTANPIQLKADMIDKGLFP